MKIVISSGHGKYIRGASGSPVPPQLDEVDEARKVVEQVATVLRSMGADVTTYHDDVSHSQSENLDCIVDFHNAQGPHDLDVSVHFNATPGAHGCEVLYASSGGEKYARKIVDAICAASGLTNRGPKHRGDLAFLNGTAETAVLIETCFCDSTSDSNIYHAKFSEICDAIAEAITGAEVQPGPTPPPVSERPPTRPPPTQPPVAGERRTLGKGDEGDDVTELQEALGVLVADGEFGSITETWVKAFQAACGLKADGIVGPVTWEEIDDLEARKAAGGPRLPERLIDRIVALAEQSEIQEYLWPDRGMTPPGYIPGMALSFAYALRQFEDGDDAATIMAKAQGGADKDALAYYDSEFKKLGMSNKTAGIDTLRHLFVMMIGLGPRESSARYCEGRDLSATNVESDTAECSLFQTSWNIRNGSDAIEPLLDDFWFNPNGFLEQFKLDVNPTADNLNCYGSGGDDGVRFQWLSRFAPLFHVMVTGVGMRVLRAHWGPIGRREVTLKREADNLLREVQKLVEAVV
jgi:N-acetylmuramoyl-L-alanine amidase/Putative peptidoglycan binding domain